MDVETPTRGKRKLKTCIGRKKDVAFGGILEDLDPRGPFTYHMDVIL
jgi:hypothetical protein